MHCFNFSHKLALFPQLASPFTYVVLSTPASTSQGHVSARLTTPQRLGTTAAHFTEQAMACPRPQRSNGEVRPGFPQSSRASTLCCAGLAPTVSVAAPGL